MKFSIERADFLRAVQTVSGIVSKRGAIPILTNVRLLATGEELTVHASDMSTQIGTRVSCHVVEPGLTTIEGAKILDLLKSLPEGADIAADQDEPEGPVKIKAGRSNFKCPTLPAEEFPLLGEAPTLATFAIGAADLADHMDQVSIMIDKDGSREMLKGLNVASFGDVLRLSGAYRSGFAYRDIGGRLEFPSTTIPVGSLGEINRMLRSATEGADVIVRRQEGRCILTCGPTELIVPVLAVQYPDVVAQIVPRSFPIHGTCDAQTLEGVVRRATIMAEGDRMIKMTSFMGMLNIAGRNQSGGLSEDELEIEVDGGDIDMTLPADRVLGILGHIKTENVTIGHIDSRSVNSFYSGRDGDPRFYLAGGL